MEIAPGKRYNYFPAVDILCSTDSRKTSTRHSNLFICSLDGDGTGY